MIKKLLKGYLIYFIIMLSLSAGLTIYGANKLLAVSDEDPTPDNIWFAIYKSGLEIQSQEVIDHIDQQLAFAKHSLKRNRLLIQKKAEKAERLKKHKMDYSDLSTGRFCESPLFESIGLSYAINDMKELNYAIEAYNGYFKNCNEYLREHHEKVKAALNIK